MSPKGYRLVFVSHSSIGLPLTPAAAAMVHRDNRRPCIYRPLATVVQTHWATISFSLEVNFDDVLSVLAFNSKAALILFNILLISASLNKNKEDVGETITLNQQC